MSLLFSPIDLGGLRLPNRVVIAPMCQYSAADGCATDWHTVHLSTLAMSGAGLLVIEATGVSPDARITPGDLGLYSDANEAALAHQLVTLRALAPATRVGIQLAHAGRKASCRAPWDGGRQIAPDAPGGWQTVAPSAVPHNEHDHPPAALDDAALDRMTEDWAAAARRAARLGIDLIEVHAAHGYLLHQFLSPLANTRTDEYGGSLENRLRFPLRVFDAVRAAFPADRPVVVRVSATDWVPGGWDVDGTVAFARALRDRGCAAIDVSSGGVSTRQQLALEPGYQVPFARRVRDEAGLPTMAVGLITEPDHAEAILREGDADMVAIARAVLYDPRWPWHAAARLGGQVDAPKQYWRSTPRGQEHLFANATR